VSSRFEKQLLLFYAAAIPTYMVMAELALTVTLRAVLPRPYYPDPRAREAQRRWAADAIASVRYGEALVALRGDVAVGVTNGARGLIEAAHSQLAARREWVTNEKQRSVAHRITRFARVTNRRVTSGPPQAAVGLGRHAMAHHFSDSRRRS
jgi:hypothetical protein